MPKRSHLKRPDLAQTVAVELRTGRDVKSQRAVHRRTNRRAAGHQPPPVFQLDDPQMLDVARRPSVSYWTKYEWGHLYSAGSGPAKCGGVFMPAGSESGNQQVVSPALGGGRSERGTHRDLGSGRLHPKPERHAVPPRVHPASLPPYSPELNPTEARNDVIKDRIGNPLWATIPDLEQAVAR